MFLLRVQLVENLKYGAQFQDLLGQMIAIAKMAGLQQGFSDGQAWINNNRQNSTYDLHGKDCKAALDSKLGEFDDLSFEVVKLISEQADDLDFDFVKQLMEGTPEEFSHGADAAGEEAGPSSPVAVYVKGGEDSDTSEFD